MKKLIVLLAITGLVGCADDYGLDRCIEKADMKYEACLANAYREEYSATEIYRCDTGLKNREKQCKEEADERRQKMERN
jgi:hypothetical protein